MRTKTPSSRVSPLRDRHLVRWHSHAGEMMAESTANTARGPSAVLAEWIAEEAIWPLPLSTTTWAKHALLDWFGVAIGGSREPLVEILVDDALEETTHGQSRLLGRAERVTSTQAALINGAASHALDFDDLNKRVYGHPSVAVAPVVMALAEGHCSSGPQVIEAFVTGYEVACQIGDMMGPSHDAKGWHATATLGVFGATAAAAKLLALDAEKTTMAFGIAATQASGLQSMFGTMCKPLHAGHAAMNGLMAARWAARGFTSNPEALACHQGFAATQSSSFEVNPLVDRTDAFAVEATLFKHHASCGLTHASLDATAALRDEHVISADDIREIRVRLPRDHLRSCDIPEPRTGAQLKFSIRRVIAMVLAGFDTADPSIYTAETATHRDLIAIGNKVRIEAEERDPSCYVADVSITLGNGQTVSKFVDVGLPATNLERQLQGLQGKFRRLVAPIIGGGDTERMIALLSDFDQLDNVLPLLALSTPQKQ